MSITGKTRYIFYITALVLLITAVIWTYALKDSTGARICRELRAYGFFLNTEELNHIATWESTTIRALLNEEDAEYIQSLSKNAGFNSDMDKQGDISLITANVKEGELLLFLVGDELEFGFIYEDQY